MADNTIHDPEPIGTPLARLRARIKKDGVFAAHRHDLEEFTRRTIDDPEVVAALPEDFAGQWNLVTRLLQALAQGGDLVVQRRGWTDEMDYRALAARLLGVADLGHPGPLLLPSTEPGAPLPKAPNPGDLNDEEDGRLAATMCHLTHNLSSATWYGLNERERIGWMRQALTEFSNGK